MAHVEPVSERAKVIQAAVSPARWVELVEEARKREAIVQAVWREREQSGDPWAQCLARVAPEESWVRVVHWVRWSRTWSDPLWERLVLYRPPPPPQETTSAMVLVAARMLRRQQPTLSVEEAQVLLRQEFGEDVLGVSPASLRRAWKAAGLARSGSGGSPEEEVVESFAGGAGLVLMQAADTELGVTERLAAAVQHAGKQTAARQGTVEPRDEGEGARDERGQFTAAYNAGWRQGVAAGVADARLGPETAKREATVLNRSPLLEMKVSTLASSLLQMGMVPQLTQRRGFDGLDGPMGGWLGALGGTAYSSATLEKRLAGVARLDAEPALWEAYARSWQPIARTWAQEAEGNWLQLVLYVDATLDPYWTQRFALTGKVERTGRVGPSVTRAVIASGPGVPLMVEEHAGMVSLKTALLPMLDRVEKVIGSEELRRLTVFDAEMATGPIIGALATNPTRSFITLLKGPLRRAVTIETVGEWLPFRKRDQVREVVVHIPAKHTGLDEVLQVRGVELLRPSERHPYNSVYLTGETIEQASTTGVPTMYLSRWPNQEQLFRDGRNGGGLNRTHGYGGSYITHVALPNRQEKAAERVLRTEKKLASLVPELEAAQAASAEKPKDPATRTVLSVVKRAHRNAEQDHNRAIAERDKLETTPRTIYARDLARDGIMTCLKLTALMLIRFVLHDYFGGLRMEYRTFIEAFVALPVTVRSTKRRVRYQFHANHRDLERMRLLQEACAVLNKRRLRREGRALSFEVVGLPPPS
jgi:hypothetical protein